MPAAYRMLGSLEVELDGRSVQLGGTKQRALLTVLLLDAGRVVPTDRLVDRLWGERPPRTALTSLQNMVSQLRKALGSERVLTQPPGYVLAAEADEVDAARFERLVRSARGAPAENRTAILIEALALWRGPPLAEFAFEPFAESEIRRLDELHLGALEDRIDADLELGRHADVVGELEGLVAEQPLRERLRGQLMLALYRSGRQAEALGAYRHARDALVEELGIEPSPALQQLHASILRQERGLAPGTAEEESDHFTDVAKALLAGRLVLVLGGGANVSGRPDGERWRNDGRYLPDAADLAEHLAERFDCPREHGRELARVSQYVSVFNGPGPLYDELHAILGLEYPAGPVHAFAASLPALLRQWGAPPPLLVTTNYDRALEQALEDAGEDVDVVAYIGAGHERGRFVHRMPDGEVRLISTPNTYVDLPNDVRPVVLKLHGEVDSGSGREWESFVVSEDDYIDYLSQTDISNLVPVKLAARLRRSHFLFLGHGVHEWRSRVFLHRIWQEQRASYHSWAVQPGAHPLEPRLWRKRDVEVVDLPLREYVETLSGRLEEVAAAALP